MKKTIKNTYIASISNQGYLYLGILFSLQVVLGYFLVVSSFFIAQNYENIFHLYSYVITLVCVIYTIYCYIFTYSTLKKIFPNYLRLIQLGLLMFYIVSLISYTFVSGSYSPFFLIGIKLAQSQIW